MQDSSDVRQQNYRRLVKETGYLLWRSKIKKKLFAFKVIDKDSQRYYLTSECNSSEVIRSVQHAVILLLYEQPSFKCGMKYLKRTINALTNHPSISQL